jgi:LacI family transcriptional regulator
MRSKTAHKRVSIRDVAKASGVSLTTVSLVLNHGDRRISQATRERVLAAISEMGYRPNRLAQGLQNRRSNILAILVPQLKHTFADVYFGELISGVYDQASRLGYKILLDAATPSFVRQKKYLELFDRCFVDGVLFMGATDQHTFIREIVEAEHPFMLVNNVADGPDYVVCDYAAAGRMAADHLVGLGHRRIGLIHGAMVVRTSRELKEAFAQGLAQRDVELGDAQMEFGAYTQEGGADAAEKLLARVPGLTAIFAGNDKMAIGAVGRLAALGRRVPEEVSIIGCDDVHQAAFATPPLTTVHTPLYELGKRCCQEMIKRIRGQSSSCRLVVPVELIVRESTGPARA